jgi:putative flippase GtrA
MQLRQFFIERKNRILLLMRYGASGIFGIIISIFVLFVWVTLLGWEETYLLGVGTGFILALAVTFILQKYWAFRDSESSRTPQQLLSYSIVAVLGLVLNTGLLAGAKKIFESLPLDFFDGWYLIAQIGIVILISIFNFCMNFLFTFRHAREERLWDR